jgi:3-methyladenine DNA glycosylase AlkD
MTEPMTTTARQLETQLKRLGDPATAQVLQRFFKTGPGQYGEGDVFVGIKVPLLRRLAKEHRGLPIDEAVTLLRSRIHEARMTALYILIHHYDAGDDAARRRIYDAYLGHTRYINNWDLVDSSAEHVVGAHLANRSKRPLVKLARSHSLWERRIAIVATFHSIKRDEFDATLDIAALLLRDEYDLIHKAVGWMLREVGKRDLPREEAFLLQHYHVMPRTMLRYAIERFPEPKRRRYLKGKA